MNFNIFNSLILAGCIQGFLFGIIWLFTKKYRSGTSYYLIALIISYSLSNLQWLLLDIKVLSNKSFYSIWFIPWALIMPPLLLFYGIKILYPTKKINSTLKVLFLPFIIGISIAIFFKIRVFLFNIELNLSTFYRSLPFWAEMIASFGNLIVIVFLFLKTNKIKKQAYDIHKVKPEIKWFQIILIALFIGTLVWIFSEILFLNENENYYFYPLWIIVSIIIYWMGHVGVYKYAVNAERKEIRKDGNKHNFISSPKNYKSETIQALENFIVKEKKFLDPQLSLENTAEHLQVSKSNLSKLINTELQKTFKNYINQLRVDKAKEYLKNPDYSSYTLIAIGLEAGFNSKSAFNNSFKKYTGITPSAYRNLAK